MYVLTRVEFCLDKQCFKGIKFLTLSTISLNNFGV